MINDSCCTKDFTALLDKAGEGERRANTEIQAVLVLESWSSPWVLTSTKPPLATPVPPGAPMSHTRPIALFFGSRVSFHIALFYTRIPHFGQPTVFLYGNWLVSLLISCLQQAAFHTAFLFSSRPRRKWERSGLSARSSFSAVGLQRVGYPEENRTMDKII